MGIMGPLQVLSYFCVAFLAKKKKKGKKKRKSPVKLIVTVLCD